MKSDLAKLLAVIWMSAVVYFMYEMWVDVNWMADAMHAYLQMIVQHARQ
mgnify:CR=1 FL=1